MNVSHMRIAIGADHAGFSLKESLRRKLEADGHDVADVGAPSAESCDYPDFAFQVAQHVGSGRADRGILVCSTGIGMAIAANKVAGVRAAPVERLEMMQLTREHNDLNVLTLGARFVDEDLAARLADVFLNTGFAGGRHARRVAKIARIDEMAGAQQ
jgi:ribose 5-phosphate isomerase B